MNFVARRLSGLFRTSGFTSEPFNIGHHQMQQLQQCRGIRVRVIDGNLEMALGLMQRKMQGSGIERMIKQEQRFHIKNSEKRVLAQKNLHQRIRSEDLSKKLKAILIKKVRMMLIMFTWLGAEINNHGAPKTLSKASSLLLRGESCSLLMFSIYPAHTNRSHHVAISNAISITTYDSYNQIIYKKYTESMQMYQSSF
ncbi:hypothetical protein ACSQ67_023006 [Phaseolus vulgaris]